MTYRQLTDRAGAIARAVHPHAAGGRVGVLGAGPATVTAAIGILGAGAAYVPLDPGYPQRRLNEWAVHAELTAVVTTEAFAGMARQIAPGVPLTITDTPDAGEHTDAAGLVVPGDVTPDDTAYLLSTSGSTGAPKGIAQTHRNVLAVADNQIQSLSITSEDRLSLMSSMSFDAAVPDVYPALLTGATLCPIDVPALGVGGAVDALEGLGVTVLHTTPTVLRYLIAAMGTRTLPLIRAVLLGGEIATYDDLHRAAGRFAPDAVLVNGYGATEVTFSAHQQFPLSGDTAEVATGSGILPIGRPLPGFTFELRPDEDTDAVDASADIGEIVVRSRHVAPGYWRDPELSGDRFSVDVDGTPTYRTGDRGRRLADGTYQCLGRIDRQLKVRGFRIEPAEVEAALVTLPGVRQSVVTGTAERLIAHVRGDDTCPARPSGSELRDRLRDSLPEHLVPDVVVMVNDFPLTPTGKIDVLALPDPPVNGAISVRGADDSREHPHEQPVEAQVRATWATVLNMPGRGTQIPADLGFFDAGGTSLTAGLLQVELAATTGRELRMAELFAHPTIDAQTRLLASDAVLQHDAVLQGDAVLQDDAVLQHDDAPGDDSDEDAIAIIGMAGRFPGADDLTSLAALQRDGIDAIHDYTSDELSALGIGDALRSDPAYVPAGGRLEDIEGFDAAFFRMAQDEAERTDPQHRLFLESSWAALEDAGCVPDRHDGRVGVFAALSVNRYFLFHLLGNPALGVIDPDDWEGMLAGTHQPDHLPGQVAYRLGLTGPAVSVQCACSSSLAAVALAAQSLLDLRCDVALAGGVNVTWPRYRYEDGGLGSPDGRCRAFDAAANGAGFSSGVGVIALKRLTDARADGDHIHAVIRGWAMTNDGATRAGYAIPGAAGQAEAIAEALAFAEITPDEVGFVEAHGSGTPLGDAIEVSALSEVFLDGGASADQSVALGSVKTNIGHLDGAAGIAGLISATLAVRDGMIPPAVHFRTPNPELELERSPFRVPATTEKWVTDSPRIAGVNSFGVGGTNVHVIITQADPEPEPESAADVESQYDAEPASWVLPLSAPDPDAIGDIAAALRVHLADHPGIRAQDATRTLALGRRWWPYRVVASGRTRAAAMEDLARIAAGTPPLACTSMDAAFVRWSQGEDVDLSGVVSGRTVSLPTYPYQRQRAWIAPARGVLV